jgi:hypothetical protein
MKKTNLRIKKEILKVITILSVFMFFLIYSSNTIFAEVIFEDNFDEQEDWEPVSSSECTYPADSQCIGMPSGWNAYRSMGEFNNSAEGDHYTINISNEHNGQGKAYNIWTESCSAGSWCADSLLATTLDIDYTELWLKFDIKIDPNWVWGATLHPAADAIKVFQLLHWDREGNIFEGFTTGTEGPIYIFDLYASSDWGYRWLPSLRCDPQETDYYCNSDPNNNSHNNSELWIANNYDLGIFKNVGQLGDGEWHHFKFHLKMNTKTNNIWNADGILEWWYDNETTPRRSQSDIIWKFSGDDTDGFGNNFGWNTLFIGGNQNNYPYPPENRYEQWYSFDNIVISTEPIPDDYVIGGNQIRADVDNNSTINTTDAILTLRNSLGLSMSGTNWIFSATTGDVNCDNVSNSTDAMLILRHSLGLDMTGTGWCES